MKSQLPTKHQPGSTKPSRSLAWCASVVSIAMLGCASCVPAPAPMFAFPDLPDLGGQALLVAVPTDNLPFSRLDAPTGAVEGFDVDLITAMAEKLNLQPQFLALDVDSALSNLNDGTYELISGEIVFTIERTGVVDFTVPNYLSKQRLAVRADESRASNLSGFRDQSDLLVAAVAGTFELESAQAYFGENRVRSFESLDAAIAALTARKVDGVVLKSIDFDDVNEQQPGALRTLAGPVAGTLQSFVLKQDSELTGPINQAINELIVDGTGENLRDKWGL